MFTDVNFLAIAASAVVAMVIGFTWYSPAVFGKHWMKLSGVHPKKEEKEAMYMSVAIGFLAALITAYVLSIFIQISGATTFVDALTIGAFVWIGFMATLQVHRVAWEQKSWNLFFLDTGNTLLTTLVVAVILTLWK